jgi:hypothetical protein
MTRTIVAIVGAVVTLVPMGAASASDQVRRYKIENAWPSKAAAQRPGGGGSGVDKGVAWISGAGGVRGYVKGGNAASRPKAKVAIRRGQWIMDAGRSR